MLYLNAIEMAEYGLEKLKSGERDQVPMRALKDLVGVVVGIRDSLSEEEEQSLLVKTTITDLLAAITIAQDCKGAEYLSASMKSALVSGFSSIKQGLCELAFTYYETHDFSDDNEQVVRIMRKVVEAHFLGGTV